MRADMEKVCGYVNGKGKFFKTIEEFDVNAVLCEISNCLMREGNTKNVESWLLKNYEIRRKDGT